MADRYSLEQICAAYLAYTEVDFRPKLTVELIAARALQIMKERRNG